MNIDKIVNQAALSIARTWRLSVRAIPYLELSIQSAVEKAWGNGYVEGSNYQISIHKATPREPQEWTDLIEKLYEPLPLSKEKARPIINAVLAAERDKHTKAYLSFRQRLNAFEQQLAAEREKSRILGNMTDGFRNQIKEHQAEYDRLSKIMEKDSLTIVELNAAFADLQTDLALATQMCDIEGKRANEAEAALFVAQAAIASEIEILSGSKQPLTQKAVEHLRSVDLSALEQHDAEVRKPLVEALKVLRGWMRYVRLPCGQYSIASIEKAEAKADAILASVNEGK